VRRLMIDLIVMGTQFSVITIYEFHTPCHSSEAVASKDTTPISNVRSLVHV
jgi:hypothetical protein